MIQKRIVSFVFVLMLVTTFLLLFPMASKSESNETLTLEPIADSYVSSAEGEKNINYGGKSYLEISKASNMFVRTKYGYLKFNLQAIPSEATIKSAYFKLYASTVTETHRIGAHYCSSNAWSELGITWNNKPSFDSTGYVLTVAYDSKWYTWSSGTKEYVLRALESPSSKLTIVVVCHDYHDTAWLWFYSKDQSYSWMEECIPKLIVNYSVPTSPTETYLLIIGAVVFLGIIVALVLAFIKRQKLQPTPPLPSTVLQPTPAPTQAPRLCPDCGRVLTEFPIDIKKCPYCGKDLTEMKQKRRRN